MEIYFRTRRLERTFSSDRNRAREYGPRMARVIRMRMAVLERARTLSDVPIVPPERCHLLGGERRGQYAIDLVHPFRLIIRPNHNPVPTREDGGIDTDRVTSIAIMEVVDYH